MHSKLSQDTVRRTLNTPLTPSHKHETRLRNRMERMSTGLTEFEALKKLALLANKSPASPAPNRSSIGMMSHDDEDDEDEVVFNLNAKNNRASISAKSTSSVSKATTSVSKQSASKTTSSKITDVTPKKVTQSLQLELNDDDYYADRNADIDAYEHYSRSPVNFKTSVLSSSNSSFSVDKIYGADICSNYNPYAFAAIKDSLFTRTRNFFASYNYYFYPLLFILSIIAILPFLSLNFDYSNYLSNIEIFNTRNNSNYTGFISDDSIFLKNEVRRLDSTLASTIAKMETANFNIESFKSSQVYIDLMKEIKRFDSVISTSTSRIDTIDKKVNTINESAFGIKLSNDIKRVDEILNKLSAKIDVTNSKVEAIPPCDCNAKLTDQQIELSTKYISSFNALGDKLDETSKKVISVSDDMRNLKVDSSKVCTGCVKKEDIDSIISPSITKIDGISKDIDELKKVELKDSRVDDLISNLYTFFYFYFLLRNNLNKSIKDILDEQKLSGIALTSNTASISELNAKNKLFDSLIEKIQTSISSIDPTLQAQFAKIREEIKTNIFELNNSIVNNSNEQEKLRVQFVKLEEELKRKQKEALAAIPVEVKTEKFDQSLLLNEIEEYIDSLMYGNKVDYALSAFGGSIISHSETLCVTSGPVNIFGLFARPNAKPEDVIDMSMAPGNCWPMKGSIGYVTIKFSHSIILEELVLSHISYKSTPDYSTAPKNLKIYGIADSSRPDDLEYLTEITYASHSKPTQRFQIPKRNYPIQAMKVEVLSNQGSEELTCLYRIQAHGIKN